MTTIRYDLVRMGTLATGTSSPLSLDLNVVGFRTALQAGIEDGAWIYYAIEDPSTGVLGRETCVGRYSLSGQTLTRVTLSSTNGNLPLVLSGHAQILILESNPKTLLNRPTTNFYTENGAAIWRVEDRMFIGEAAEKFAGTFGDSGTSWLSDASLGPSWAGITGYLVVSNHPDNRTAAIACSIVGAARTQTGGSSGAIGVAGIGENAGASANVWAFYADITHNAGTFSSYGLEAAIKNASGLDTWLKPTAQVVGAYALWLAGGSDDAYGPLHTSPSTAAMVVLKGSTTWNSGVVFMQDALSDGEAISMSAVAVAGNAHRIQWYDGSGNRRGYLTSQAASFEPGLFLFDNGLVVLVDNKSVGIVTGPSNAVNWATMFGSAAGSPIGIQAGGSDTDIDLYLLAKGSGHVRFGDFFGSTVTHNGYVEIKASDGTVKKIMCGA